MQRLTARRVATLKRPGRYSDGHGLMLFVQKSGARSWVQRITLPDGRRVDRGLGSVDLVSLAQAREWALANKLAVRKGIDPFTAQRSKVPTFAAACERAAEAAPLAGRNEVDRRAALERYCGGAFMGRRLDTIRRTDVIAVLAPVMAERPALGAKLKGWIRGAFAWGVAREHLEYNPADGISAALPKQNGNGKHHAALPYGEVGAALPRLDASGAAPAVKAAIRFIALTACRSGEVRGATWDEVDLDAREWRIPAARMKAGAEHRVPLSDAAVDVLRAAERHRGDGGGFVFPSSRGRLIRATVLLRAWQAATGTATTLHGLRAAFRTWAAEQTDTTRDVCEMALAHVVGSDIERSYARSDLFDRRRRLMDQWAEFVSPY